MGVTFKLRDPSRDHIVKWPVKVPVVDENGAVHSHTLTAHFKVLGRSEINRLVGEGGLLQRATGNGDLLREVWVDWSGVGQEGIDGEVNFTPELRDQVLDDVATETALVNGYFEMLAGRKAKN